MRRTSLSAVGTFAAILGATVIAQRRDVPGRDARSAVTEGAVSGVVDDPHGPIIIETCHCVPDFGGIGSLRAAAESGVSHPRRREEFANVAEFGARFAQVFIKPGQTTWSTGEGRPVTGRESVVLVHALSDVQIQPTGAYEVVATYRAIRPLFVTRGTSLRDISVAELGRVLEGTSGTGPARVLLHGGPMQSDSIDLLLARLGVPRSRLGPRVERVSTYAGLLRRALEVEDAIVIGLKGMEFAGLTAVSVDGVDPASALAPGIAASAYPLATSVSLIVRRDAADAGHIARRLAAAFEG